jgi:exodeoxyribonuclease VIII
MAQIWNVDNNTYHADKTKIGASMLKVALASPQEYRRRFIDAEPLVDGESDSLTLGSMLHCLVLEPENFSKLFAVRPDVDGRTKEGKSIIAAFRLASLGKTEAEPNEKTKAEAMARAVLADETIASWVKSAIKERGVTWEEEGVAYKMKADLFIEQPHLPHDLILDLKTSDDPTPENWGSGSSFSPIRKYRYDLQAAHYAIGMEALTGRPCGFGAIVVGKSDPYDVYVYDLSAWLPAGAWQRARAIDAINHCRETNVWQRPEQSTIIKLEPSPWDRPE